MGALRCLRLFKGAHCKIYPKSGYPSLVPWFLACTNCSSHLIGCSSILTELRFVLYKTANITSKDLSWNYMNSSPQTLQRLPISVMWFCYSPWPPPLSCYSDPISHSFPLLTLFLLLQPLYCTSNILSLLLPQVLKISILSTWNILPLVISRVSASKPSGLWSKFTLSKRTF